MGRIAVTIAIMAVASGIVHAGGLTITGNANVSGQVHLQTLDDKALVKHPSWDPQTGACPLDPGKAAKLAVQTLRKSFPSADHLKLHSITVHSVDYDDMKGKWYYSVSFYGRRASGERDSANVIICLDGTVPEFVFERKE